MTKTTVARPGGAVAQLGADVAAGGDVDALEGLVEDQQAAGCGHPAADHDLLLVAARQREHLVALGAADDAEIAAICRGQRRVRRRGAITPSAAESGCRKGRLMFVVDVEVGDDAVVGAVLGDQEHAARRWPRAGVGGAIGACRPASSLPANGLAAAPNSDLGERGLADADEAGDRDDLAVAERQGEGRGASALQLQAGRPAEDRAGRRSW